METKTAEEPHPIHEKWNQIWRTGQRPDLNGEQHVWEAMKEYAEFRLTQQQEINAELQDWKAAQIKLTLPLQEFMHAHPELKYGDQAHEKAIEFIKERDELKKQNEELIGLVKMAQNLTAGTSKESFRRFDLFMNKSTEFFKTHHLTTK